MNNTLKPFPFEEKDTRFRSIFEAAKDGLILLDLETGCVVEANPEACRMHAYPRQEFIGMPLTAILHPDCQKSFQEHLRAFQSNGIFDTRSLHLRRDGSTFSAEWHGAPLIDEGRRCLLGTIRDVSKRIRAEQMLHQRVVTRTLEQEKILEISHTLASMLEFQPGLILDQLREIVEYSQGGLFALKDSALVTLAMRGTAQIEQGLPNRIPLQGPEAVTALFNGHLPIRIADVGSDTPQAQFLRSLLADGAAVLVEGMQSWMWVPLAVRGRIIGGIGVAGTRKNYFTAHQAVLAQSVANQAAITMINAELYGQAHALAVLEERQHLARELHDAVNQSLFSAGLIAEVLPRLWDRDQEEARRSIEDLRRLTRGAQAEMRALLAELRPSTLTDSNLDELLHLLANALTGRTNIPVTVMVTGDYILPNDVQIAFYRICQEALFNIAKHAKARQVEILLNQDGETIELRIQDDGQGFDPGLKFSGHYGLSMMQERAEVVGARISVMSHPGQGTHLTIWWTKPPSKEFL